MFNLTCGHCKRTDDFDLFSTSENNRYSCPFCGVTWRIERDKPAQFFENGFVIPPTRKIVVERQMMLPSAG